MSDTTDVQTIAGELLAIAARVEALGAEQIAPAEEPEPPCVRLENALRTTNIPREAHNE